LKPVQFEDALEVRMVRAMSFNAMNGLAALRLTDAVVANGIIAIGIEILDERGNRLGQADQADHATALATQRTLPDRMPGKALP
jgi:hypothetical protein